MVTGTGTQKHNKHRNAGEGSLLNVSGRVKTRWSVKQGIKSKRGRQKSQVGLICKRGRNRQIRTSTRNSLESLAMTHKTIWQRTSGSEGAK